MQHQERSEAAALPSNVLRTMPYTWLVATGAYAVVFRSSGAAWCEAGLVLNELLIAAVKAGLRKCGTPESRLLRGLEIRLCLFGRLVVALASWGLFGCLLTLGRHFGACRGLLVGYHGLRGPTRGARRGPRPKQPSSQKAAKEAPSGTPRGAPRLVDRAAQKQPEGSSQPKGFGRLPRGPDRARGQTS